MRIKQASPDKSAIETNKPNVSPTQDMIHSESIPENEHLVPQINNPTTSDSLEPNIINLYNVDDVEEWIRSGGVYVGHKVNNEKLTHEGSKWGNPHPLKVHKSRSKVVEMFRETIMENEEVMKDIGELKGKKLGCWCSPHRCHAEVLHELAGNRPIYEREDLHELAENNLTHEDEASHELARNSPTYESNASSMYVSSLTHSPLPLNMTESIKPDMNLLVKCLTDMEAHLNEQKIHIHLQNEKISQLEKRISTLEGDLVQTKAHFSVRDHVIEALRGEIHRLQQYTRRYSVTIKGIDKEKDEKPEDLREKVLKLVTDVNSTTQEPDIDKFHRNGRRVGKEQDIILRFKSHSAKEVFYKARKNLINTRKEVKIRPSLSNNQINLLRDAEAVVEEFNFKEEIMNPVDFVFANVHGQTQVKLREDFRGSPFLSFNTIPELIRKLQEAQVVKEAETAYEEVSSRWDDDISPSRRTSAHASRHRDNYDNDDMGFGDFS